MLSPSRSTRGRDQEEPQTGGGGGNPLPRFGGSGGTSNWGRGKKILLSFTNFSLVGKEKLQGKNPSRGSGAVRPRMNNQLVWLFQQGSGDDDPLDLVSPLVDLRDLCIAKELFCDGA